MLFYEIFYRNYGIRKAEQLIQPPLPELERLELPKRSILHYYSANPLEGGPGSDEFLFRNVTKPIQMAHITENGDTKGQPRRIAVAVDPLVRKYHIKNRRFRVMRDLQQATRDDQTLVVYNYGFIPALYRYMRSYYSEYYKWMNVQAAVWKNIAAVAQESDRNQFVVCTLPKILPSLPDLNIGTQGVNQRMATIFSTGESLMLLELWKWFGSERADSVLNHVPANRLDRVNLIYQESGRWFVLNLGLLNSWRQATKEELAIDPTANTKGLAADQMQRRFLRLMMSLSHVRTEAAPEVDQLVDASAKPVPLSGPAVDTATPEVVTQSVAAPKANPDTGIVEKKATAVTLPVIADAGVSDRGEDLTADPGLDARIDADLAELETISKQAIKHVDEQPEVEVIEQATLEEGVMNVCDRLADMGQLSAAEYRRYGQLAAAYRSIPAPNGQGTLDQFIEIPQEVLKIEESPKLKDIKTVVDKSMLSSSLLVFDERYIKQVMPRDVAAMVLNIQHAGIAVTSYEVERVEDILGSYDDHVIRVTPVDGASSTFRFKLPALEDDGTYMANGVKYRMRKQRGDLPIRKIAPARVALTSYYGKAFVNRSEKRVNDYGQWLRNAVMARGLDDLDTSIVNLAPANVFDNTFGSPKAYSALAQGFRAFTVQPVGSTLSYDLSFDHTARERLYGAEALRAYEKDGALVIGVSSQREFVVMDRNNAIYLGANGTLRDIGSIEGLLSLDAEKAPVDFAELKVLGRAIPVGVVLGYELGLERLMKLLGVEPRRVPAGSRTNLSAQEYALVFSDETLVFSKDDKLAAIVLAGFNEFHRAIRTFSVYEFDKRGVYLNVLESAGPSTRYLREIDLLYQLFIDPITRDLLIEMKEPTNFRGLLMRSCELLLSDQHPNELDPAYMRIKGYERMAGAVYSEIVRSIRAHNGRTGKSKLPIDLNPYAVWKNISQDPAIAMVSDINPIENLKQMEAVTYSGVGGRGSRSMTKHTREYHRNDMGTISESTVDSSDVAINTFTSADPQFTSLRGISKRYKIGETGATALLSTSALLSPGSDMDDPKRVNFIGIQNSHGVACSGYRQAAVRTGYEQVLAHRTSDLFALTAKKPGRVISVTPTGLVVQYADGETKGIELGRRYGNAAGLVIPHSVVSDLKEGQEFKEGDLLCHNDGFFERDVLNPNQVVWKAGIIVKTVLLESTDTLEDSSALSARAAALLTTKATKVKHIVVNFDQSVKRLVKVGDVVESENILCIIEDAVTANNDLFDEQSLDTLRVLSAQTPQAKAKGVVERIEVFYHGDKEDMSESLRAIALASDRELSKRSKSSGKKPFTGSVDDGFRIDGDPLALDTLAIRVYITSDVPAGVGDKGVFCNQMKTVFGKVMTGSVTTESGKEIDAIFGQKSIADRIVLSPEIIGTTTTLLDVIGKKALAAYKS